MGNEKETFWFLVVIILFLLVGAILDGCAPSTLQDWARDCAAAIQPPHCWGG